MVGDFPVPFWRPCKEPRAAAQRGTSGSSWLSSINDFLGFSFRPLRLLKPAVKCVRADKNPAGCLHLQPLSSIMGMGLRPLCGLQQGDTKHPHIASRLSWLCAGLSAHTALGKGTGSKRPFIIFPGTPSTQLQSFKSNLPSPLRTVIPPKFSPAPPKHSCTPY